MRIVLAIILLMVGVFLLALATDTGQESAAVQPTITPTLPPGREPIELPDDYRDTLVHYATIDRIDGISRDLYISPQAIDALVQGQPFPDRTIVLIEAFESSGRDDDGRLIRTDADPEVHLAEARSTWQIADLAASSRVGNWNFGAFDVRDASVFESTGLNDCFSCHEAVSNRNFLFTEHLLEAFVENGEVQYFYCQRSGRRRCF